MSVLAKRQLAYFKAPLSISESKVTVSGSWSATTSLGPMEASHLFQMRLHVWKQQYQSKVANACLDWIVLRDESVSVKHFLIFKIDNLTFSDCLQDETFNSFIQGILNDTSTIVPVAQTFSNCIQGHV